MFWNSAGKLKRLKDERVPERVLREHRERLLAHMAARPMRLPASPTARILSWRPAMAVFLLAAALSGMGGAVYAAQGSLPGETLYPVKLASEAVQARLVLSDESRFRFHAERAERRLAEAEAVMEASGADEERLEKAMARYEEHLSDLHEAAPKSRRLPKQKLLLTVDRLAERHDRLIGSASASPAVIRPARASMELEMRLIERFSEDEDVRRFHEERGEAIRERMERVRTRLHGFEEGETPSFPARPAVRVLFAP